MFRPVVLAASLAAAISLSACSTTSGSGSTTGSTTLAQVQQLATLAQSDIAVEIQVYEAANTSLSSADKANITQAMTDLSAAVAALNAVQPGANYATAVNAFLTVAQSVVNNLPDGTLSVSTTADVDAAIAAAKILVSLVSAATAS